MLKNRALSFFLFCLAVISFSLMMAVTVTAEEKVVEEVELINTQDLSGNIQYYESNDTIFWKLFVIKHSGEEKTSLSVQLTSETINSQPQVSQLSDNLIQAENNMIQEATPLSGEQNYLIEFSTPKSNAKSEGALLIDVDLTLMEGPEQGTALVSRSKNGHFSVTPTILDRQTTATGKEVSGIEPTKKQAQLMIPSIMAEDTAVYPAVSGQSFLSEIQPFFSGVSAADPFAYSTDTTGKYDTHNNGINQGTEVRNYNYSQTDSSALIAGRNRPPVVKPPVMTGKTLDFTTGYHDYSGAYLKKWVEPAKDQNGIITDPTLFNLYLEVIGDANQVTTPIDIILVLDKSGSMNDSIGSETKDTQLRASVRNFSNSLLTSGLDIKIGLVNYGSSTSEDDGGTPLSQTQALTATAATINNSTVLTRTPLGSTPTDLGLRNGIAALYGTGERPAAKKIMVFLSDGAPTKFYQPTQVRSRLTGPPPGNFTAWGDYLATNNGTTPGVSSGPLFNYDGSLIASNEKFPNQFVTVTGFPATSTNPNTQYEYRWNNYQWIGTGWTDDGNAEKGMIYTLGYANWLFNQDPKYAAISLYSIGLGIGGSDEIATIGRNTLKNLAKNPANYYSADTQGQLVTIFGNIASNIVKTIQNGHIMDPLGDGVTLVGEPKVDSFSVGASGKTTWSGAAGNDPKQAVTLTKTAGNRSLEWRGLTIGKNEGLRFSYQVQLTEPYQTGLFYQANGATYLENSSDTTPPYDTANRMHFAIPSVRYKGLVDIKVKKIWVDGNNQWGLRTPVTLKLQRMIPSGAFQDVSGKTVTIQPGATGTQLETTFTGLEKFDSTGQRYTYQVVETNSPAGYGLPAYSDQELTVTNTLLTTNVTFKKFDHDGQTPLPNVTFELTAANNKKLQATSDATGLVTFNNIPIGTHTITEVTAPTGYQAVPPFKVTVSKVSDSALTSTFDLTGVSAEMFKLTGQDLAIINRYERGRFSFKKVGNDGIQALGQVRFTLNQNNQVIQDTLSGTDGSVTFTNIYPGIYTLKEVSTPNGYSLIGDLQVTVTKNKNALGELIVQGLPANGVIRNRLKNFSLSLNKVAVDNLSQGIQGAEFTLYDEGVVKEKQLTTQNGTLKFSQLLEPGKTYTVKETAVPKGYLPIKGVFTIQLLANGAVLIDYDGTQLSAAKNQLAVNLTSGTADNTISYTVTNDPKRPLPNTGGFGIYHLIAAGLVLMVGSWVYWRKVGEA